ncbi:MAG: hypothetical protein PHQ05_05850 [Sterolibacterium sp.]|nr:hypothetical protein [Sterolibacterium sp.]
MEDFSAFITKPDSLFGFWTTSSEHPAPAFSPVQAVILTSIACQSTEVAK